MAYINSLQYYLGYEIILRLFTCFSYATMVREVTTSTAASSDPNHQKVQNSEHLQEHRGIYRAISSTLNHLKRNRITIVLFVSTPDVIMEDESRDLLCCDERLPSSPGPPSSDSYIEYGT